MEKPPAFRGIIGTFMGRDGLSLIARHLNLKESDCVLLPAYGCQEVVKPFAGRAKIVFYDIAADLTITPETISELIRRHQPKAFLLINYFGFLQPRRLEIKQLCQERGVTLIEDCAHSLLTDGSDTVGDISIFSFRKHLPLADGGGVRLPSGDATEANFAPRVYANVLSLLSRLKSVLKVRSAALSRSGMQGEPQPDSNGRILPMSTFARRAIAKVDLADVVQRCREDYLRWDGLMSRCDIAAPLFPSLPSGVCPLGYPMRSSRREEIVEALAKQNVWLKRYWRLSALVGAEHANSHLLAKEVFALPVYPELKRRDFEIISEVLFARRPMNAELCGAQA